MWISSTIQEILAAISMIACSSHLVLNSPASSDNRSYFYKLHIDERWIHMEQVSSCWLFLSVIEKSFLFLHWMWCWKIIGFDWTSCNDAPAGQVGVDIAKHKVTNHFIRKYWYASAEAASRVSHYSWVGSNISPRNLQRENFLDAAFFNIEICSAGKI
jgi:hypothetical protein